MIAFEALDTLVDPGLGVAVWLPSAQSAAPRTKYGAHRRRRADHYRGRIAAARALGVLDAQIAESEFAVRPIYSAPAHFLGADSDGCPTWPAGFTGSISHTASMAVAVAARTERARSVGIDVERIHARSALFASRVMRPEDYFGIPAHQPTAMTATAFFSIRESVFKCVFPLQRRPMDWHDCVLRMKWDDGTFDAWVRADEPGAHPLALSGRFRSTGALFASVCWWTSKEF